MNTNFERMIPPSMRMSTNWGVELYYQNQLREGLVTRRDKIYRFLASPSSSAGAHVFALTILENFTAVTR
jgi:hypothetical protein